MLEIKNLSIDYNFKTLFEPISFSLDSNNILALMGKSGIGKTSIIKAIANTVNYNGSIIKPSTFTVFQDSNQLFPWYNVRKNLDLVCKTDYSDTLKSWNMQDYLDYYPNELSNGQRQRLTLLRALHSGNKLLLCDEPTTGLDYITRHIVLNDFKKRILDLNLSCLWVTHDLSEAKLIADNIFFLDKCGIKVVKRNINEQKFIAEFIK
jgi:ABC-type nitrate/sulfonate/bicarbonate transport system ATPase subunit